MKDQVKKADDLTPLPDYLRQQGCLANPHARAGIMDKIATGKLTAYMKIEPAPAPAGRSFVVMVRDALADAPKPKHVLARDIPKVMSEVEKAAMAVDADWNLLNRLLIDVSVENSKERAEPKPPERHVYKKEKHLELILDALRAEGFEPKALPAHENGKATPKAMVYKILVEKKKLLKESQFKRGWEYGKEIHEVDFVAA